MRDSKIQAHWGFPNSKSKVLTLLKKKNRRSISTENFTPVPLNRFSLHTLTCEAEVECRVSWIKIPPVVAFRPITVSSEAVATPS